MIHKLIIICTFVTTLNPVIKLSTWAALDTNWRNSLAEARPTAATAFADEEDFDTWQPAVQSQNWLITTASTAPLALTSSQHRESERFSLMIQRRQQQHQQYRPNRYYVYNHHNGNYTKQQIAPLSAESTSTTSDQSVPKTATIKLKPYVVASKDANANANIDGNGNYRRYNPMKRFPLVEHLHPYAPHMARDADSAGPAERRADASQHFKKTDVNRQSQHPYPANHRMSPAMIDSRLSHIPATTKETFTVTNANLKDTAATTPHGDDEANEINEILLPLHAALDKVKQFCDIVKDIITDDKDEGDDDNKGDQDGAIEDIAADDEDLSNEDGNDDNDLTNSNFAPVLAAVKVLLMKKPTTTSSYLKPKPVEQVQGHARETDMGRLEEDSLAPSPSSSLASVPKSSPAAAPLPASSAEAVTSRAFAEHRTLSSAAPAHTPRLRIPKVGSKRKLKKKIKKKFKKFLFPLLVAYKLKFLALIPLLIGGLTLLVGSTGLAGFFFALFAAVMTMKSGHGRSIVVAKY